MFRAVLHASLSPLLTLLSCCPAAVCLTAPLSPSLSLSHMPLFCGQFLLNNNKVLKKKAKRAEQSQRRSRAAAAAAVAATNNNALQQQL